jgi:hypothetical protein
MNINADCAAKILTFLEQVRELSEQRSYKDGLSGSTLEYAAGK